MFVVAGKAEKSRYNRTCCSKFGIMSDLGKTTGKEDTFLDQEFPVSEHRRLWLSAHSTKAISGLSCNYAVLMVYKILHLILAKRPRSDHDVQEILIRICFCCP